MFGGEHLGSPYALPNVRANLVFAHYARFALMPKSCGFTTLCYTHSVDQPGIQRGKCKSRIVPHNEAKASEKAEFTWK
ncbi:MAG: hypothetical protein BECKG1743E_GA0114224_100284 [Candidatus Kentron sp. G]|nr:MAG: hypothetical protein BECKG1743E_GA0114224_100284 [Candidatus Kentron sp. G]